MAKQLKPKPQPDVENQEKAPDFIAQPVPPLAPKIKNNKNTNLKKQLAKIYLEVQQDTAKPLTKKGGSAQFLFFSLSIIIFLAAVAWAGFFLLGQGPKFSEDNVKIFVSGPDKILTNEDITYKIIYKNAGRLPLGNSSLSVRYPDGFNFVSSTPQAATTDNREWNFGSLNSNQEGVVEITGKVLTPANSDITLRTFFSYRPANFNADFQKITNFSTHMEPWPINILILGPEEITSDEGANFSVSLFNSSDKTLNNLEFLLNLPIGLKIVSANPSPTNNLWQIKTFGPQATSSIDLSLAATSEIAAGDQVIKLGFSTRQNNQSFSQKNVEKNIKVIKSNLILQLAANGTTEKQSINFGDKINFSMDYENSGNTTIKNASLRLILDGLSVNNKSLFDWANIVDKADGAITGEQKDTQMRRGVITWTKTQIPALAEIKPKNKGIIELTLPIKNKANFDISKLTQFQTTVYGEFLVNNASNNNFSGLQSNNLILILNSDLNVSLQATAKETEDLPPTIGEHKYDTKTIYNLVWNVTNSLHELTELQITATLPENVDWEKSFSTTAGDVVFDETTKQITWKLNRLPIGVNKIVISFDLGIKSKDAEIGHEATLIEKARVEAKDKATGENLLFWKDPIITVF